MARPRVTREAAALDAAARCLSAGGVAHFSIDDVAAELGVSRATVYRYVGGRDEVIAAVIEREGRHLLAGLIEEIDAAPSFAALVTRLVEQAAAGIDQSPVLSRLATIDLRETLEFVTIDAAPLIDAVVSVLVPAIVDAASFDLSGVQIDSAVQEATRLVLSDVTTPRRDGSRLSRTALAEQTSLMVVAAFGARPAGRRESMHPATEDDA